MSNKRLGAVALQWILLAGCLAAGGCVVVEEPARADRGRADSVYRTGSRLPSPDATSGGATVGAVSKEDWDSANIRREGTLPPAGTIGR